MLLNSTSLINTDRLNKIIAPPVTPIIPVKPVRPVEPVRPVRPKLAAAINKCPGPLTAAFEIALGVIFTLSCEMVFDTNKV